MIMTLLF